MGGIIDGMRIFRSSLNEIIKIERSFLFIAMSSKVSV